LKILISIPNLRSGPLILQHLISTIEFEKKKEKYKRKNHKNHKNIKKREREEKVRRENFDRMESGHNSSQCYHQIKLYFYYTTLFIIQSNEN